VRRVLVGLAVALGVAASLPAPRTHGGFWTRTTYFNLSGVMADGSWVHPGAAACPRAYMGAWVHVVAPDVWVQCEDTGAAWYFETGEFRLDVWAASRPWWLDDWMEVEVAQ